MDIEATLNQVDRWLSSGDPSSAERALNAAWPDISKAPAEAQHSMANVRLAQGRRPDAEKLLRAAVRAEPNSLRHHIALGHLLFGGDDPAGASEVYAVAMRIDPNWPGLVINYAKAAYLGRRYAEAEAAARQWIAADATAAAYDTLSCALREQGKHQEALAAADKALHVTPNDPGAMHSRGAALLRLGQNQEALMMFDGLIASGVHAPVVYLNRGKALLALKREREAADAFAEGARRYPGDRDLAAAARR